MNRNTSQWLIPIVLALGAAAGLWYYWVQVNEPVRQPQRTAPPPAAAMPQPAPEPLHPIPESAPAPEEERPALVPLPPLDQIDEYFKLALSDLFGSSIDDVLVSTGVIQRIVATVDALPRPQVAERIRPLSRPQGQFAVDGQDDSGEFSINRSNFDRYEPLVEMIANADLEEVGAVYRRFYPLFQKSYVELGYPDGYFNDRLVEVLDHLLATPDIGDSVALVRPHVLYEYADPDLENLSGGQKLLLRMGSENRQRIKQSLRELRGIVTRL
jgi:hypothetical protein